MTRNLSKVSEKQDIPTVGFIENINYGGKISH